MILIADSGSTKTQWDLIDIDNKKLEVHSEGINPYFQSREQIKLSFKDALTKIVKHQAVMHIYYYGAGCGSQANKDLLKDVFKEIFPLASVEIYTDLLGAARAACGNEPGIAAILGTGSNSCDYDGTMISANMPSLGYILGDEGSGAYIGKQFIQDFLNKELPNQIASPFNVQYQLTQDKIIQAVYKEQKPNKFLASFVRFLYEYKKDPYVHGIFKNAFELFFEKHIIKYENYQEKPLSCVGSVAYYFKEILQEVCDKNKVVLKKVIEKPIEGICAYHMLAQNRGESK